MKLIDGRGRIFGIINIIDLSIIFTILVIAPFFIYSYRIMSKLPERVPHKWIRAHAIAFVLPEIASNIKPGDVSRDGIRNVDGRVLKAFVKDGEMEKDIKQIILMKDWRQRIPVHLELELACTKSAPGESWYYRRSPLVVDMERQFDFNTDKYTLNCYLVEPVYDK